MLFNGKQYISRSIMKNGNNEKQFQSALGNTVFYYFDKQEVL